MFQNFVDFISVVSVFFFQMLMSAKLLPLSVTSMQTAGTPVALIAVLARTDSTVMAKLAKVRIEQRLLISEKKLCTWNCFLFLGG